jgi:ubiquinone biosynthesis protein
MDPVSHLITPFRPKAPRSEAETIRGHRADAFQVWCRVATIGFCVLGLLAVTIFHAIVRRERLRYAFSRQFAHSLSRLGTAPIKLGQLIASSPGTFPEPLVQACSGLRDQVETTDDVDVHALLRAQLGEASRHFGDIDMEPIAAASIAQVHAGHLSDGTAVAIKVLRPGIRRTLVIDLRLLSCLVRAIARVAPPLRRMDIAGVMATLAQQLLAELDFEAELHNAQSMEVALAGTGVRIPHFFGDLCTHEVLVMELLEGRPLSTSATDDHIIANGGRTARRILESLLVPLASHGVFHADMHAGNLLVGPTGDLALVDFGFVCHLEREVRDELAHALQALFERRFHEAALKLVGLVDVSHADLTAACDELTTVTSKYLDQEIGNMPMGQIIRDLLNIGTSHGLVLPTALVSLMRQMLFLDGITRDLDPSFNFLDEGARIMARVMDRGRESGSTLDPQVARLELAA